MGMQTIRLSAIAFIYVIGVGHLLFTPVNAGFEAQVRRQRGTRTQRSPRPATVKNVGADYSKFSHNTIEHKKACDSCHKFPTANWNKVRTGEAAFPDVTDYPEHPSCIECHRKQFFSGARPKICSICHTNPSPNDGSRHPFPNPAEIFNASKKAQTKISEFGVSFPHDKHVEIVGKTNVLQSGRILLASFTQEVSAGSEPKAEESDPKSCAVCHKTYQPQGDSNEEYVTKPPKNLAEDSFWLKKGTFKSNPTHATCFTCHGQDGIPPAATDCATCHKLLSASDRIQLDAARDDYDSKLAASMALKDKLMLERWSRRETVKFRHEWAPHSALSCTTCHTIATLNTLDKKTRTQVKSCGGEGSGCHIEATSDGILNLELQKKRASPAFECTKCHIRNGKSTAPESHINAVSAATKK